MGDDIVALAVAAAEAQAAHVRAEVELSRATSRLGETYRAYKRAIRALDRAIKAKEGIRDDGNEA